MIKIWKTVFLLVMEGSLSPPPQIKNLQRCDKNKVVNSWDSVYLHPVIKTHTESRDFRRDLSEKAHKNAYM